MEPTRSLDPLFDAVRTVDEPTAEDRERVRRKVLARVAVGATVAAGVTAASAVARAAGPATASAAAGVSSTTAAPTVVTAATGLSAAAKLSIAVLSLSAAGGVGVVARRTLAPSPSRLEAPASHASREHELITTRGPSTMHAPDPRAEAQPSAAPIEPGPPVPLALVPATPSVRAAETPSRAAPLLVRRAPPVEASAEVDTLEAESALLADARSALIAGAPQRSLALLERYRSDFPRGALRVDALAAQAITLCTLGRYDEAAPWVAQVERATHDSALRDRVRERCAPRP